MKAQKFENPILFIKRAQELTLSGKSLIDIMQAVLSRGKSFRFRARGWSMTPFIRDGDVITISPIIDKSPGVGEVVAFIRSNEEKLVVHRVVSRNHSSLYIQGDSNPECMFDKVSYKHILGKVSSIERNGRRVWLGLGLERYLIAWLSRTRMLVPIRSRVASLKARLARRAEPK